MGLFTESEPMLENLEKKTQLHEGITIYYTVSPMYTAYFEVQDGGRRVAEATGETILEALQNLDKVMANIEVRGR